MLRRRTRGPGADAILPGYSHLEEIGGGAFATVFRAVETETGRPVALKILNVDTIHAHLIETFHKEIRALAAISDHPNIVTLYRPSTTTDGRPVLVLELCRESLGRQLRTSGPLGSPDVTRVGIKIAGALETAHRNGFLHRDMKPQNVLVTHFGEPALADFGVAALQASAQVTAGVFGFTTPHAAPEMLEGLHLSPATDVYGLASTMYQLLSGRTPLANYANEAPASVILRILRDPVPPLRAEHIPLELADLLESALSKEPEGRPRSAAEFARSLQQVEARQGWPETSFVAWDEEGVSPAAARPAGGRGPMGAVAGSAAGAGVGSGAGSRAVAGSAGTPPPAGVQLPPLLPPSTPLPRAGPNRPSLVMPGPAARNVVEPVEAVRGRMGPPVAADDVTGGAPVPVPPRPLPADVPDHERRPTFVDPDPPGRQDPTDPSVGPYRVPAPAPHVPAPPGPPPAPPGPAPHVPMWAVAALVLAALVIVASVLLVAGMI